MNIAQVSQHEKLSAEFGRACAESMQALLPNAGIASEEIAGGIAVFAGVDSPMTQAIAVGLNGPVVPQELARLENFFFSRGASVNLELTPYIDTSVLEWITSISEHPYTLVDFSEVLALDLDQLVIPPHQADDAIAIHIAQPEEYKLFISTLSHGYTHGAHVPDADLTIFEGFARAPGVLSFFATIDGAPAGGGTLTIEEGIAGFHGGSTLPQFRNRGVQTALILARLHAARQRGCKLAYTVTHPTGSSQRNMARFGFARAYTRVKMSRPCDKETSSS